MTEKLSINPPKSRSEVLPIAQIRDHFPALGRLVGGKAVAYFDGPGGTQVPRHVVEAMSDYLYNHNANTHWSFPTSQETDQALAEARQVLADFINAAPREIVFGANMTTLTLHLARALGRGFAAGDEIVVTELDHHANVDPWREMARERGLTVRVVRMDPQSGQLDRDDLRRQIGGRTKVVAIGAASNALGTINDVAEAGWLARQVGAVSFVDAVHYAPHRLVDVRALGCDFLACSAYKFHGPHVGMLYGKHKLLERLDTPKLWPAPNMAPERLETGTQNHEGIVGAAAAVEFLAGLGTGATRRDRLRATFEALHERGRALVDRLWHGLSAVHDVTLYGPGPAVDRTPTVSFTVADLRSEAVCRHLADQGLFASHGDFYATTAVARLGQSQRGLVRIGCACYTTEEEIDRLLAAVLALVAG
jgi:cysteine desulfurase family protein (TIGR01976 family)